MDTKNWEWFRYDEIFEIKHGFYNKKPDNNPNGNIPFVGATDSNNGVTSYSDMDTIKITSKTGDENNAPLEEKVFEKCIAVTNNGSVGYAYYQDKLFTCTHDVNPIYLKNYQINKFIALFLCTVIEKDRFRWAYGRKWRPKRMPNSLIKLPVDTHGNPDWQWIEDYVKNNLVPKLPDKSKSVWKKEFDIKPLLNNKLQLNTKEWKWFKYTKLFNIKGSITTPKIELEESGFGLWPYVTTQAINNGIEGFYNIKTEKGNILTVDSAVLGYCAYQEKDFSASDHVEELIPKFHLTSYIAMFLTTIINKEQYRYNYGRKCSQTKLKKSQIKLPAIKNDQGEYEPDWQWMEDYIKGLPYSGCL